MARTYIHSGAVSTDRTGGARDMGRGGGDLPAGLRPVPSFLGTARRHANCAQMIQCGWMGGRGIHDDEVTTMGRWGVMIAVAAPPTPY